MRMRTVLTVIAAALVALVVGIRPAEAKGPADATVTGVGIDQPIHLSGGPEGSGDTFWRFVESSGFFEGTYGTDAGRPMAAAPTGDLGPELVVMWTLPTGTTTEATIRQLVYPWAAGGPMSYTEPGQPYYDGAFTTGGWWRAGANLPDLLVTLGVPARATLEAAVQAPATTVPPSPVSAPTPVSSPSPADAGGGSWMWLGLALPLVAAAAVAAVAGRRATRRARVVPT